MESKRLLFQREIETSINDIRDYSDFIFAVGLDIKELTPEVLKLDIIPTMIISTSAFNALAKMNIPKDFLDKLKQASMYTCPWTENTYFGTLPIAVATFNKNNYKDLLTDYQLDTEFHLSMNGGDVKKLLIPNLVELSFIGHGYTSATLPSDGSHTLVLCTIELPNKDFAICLTYAWHNK
jgi:hypothetical protein